MSVSIHAPAREATPRRSPSSKTDRFNPRPRTGGDGGGVDVPIGTGMFQSTPPHGRRRCKFDQPVEQGMFQSTPPHGRRRG